MNGYRVSFFGVYPSLFPSGDDRQVLHRHCQTRKEAQALFDTEPRAYRLDRWEAQTQEWVMLLLKDRSK